MRFSVLVAPPRTSSRLCVSDSQWLRSVRQPRTMMAPLFGDRNPVGEIFFPSIPSESGNILGFRWFGTCFHTFSTGAFLVPIGKPSAALHPNSRKSRTIRPDRPVGAPRRRRRSRPVRMPNLRPFSCGSPVLHHSATYHVNSTFVATASPGPGRLRAIICEPRCLVLA